MILIPGFVLIVLGVLVLISSMFVGAAVIIYIGALMALAGLATLVQTFNYKEAFFRNTWGLVGLITLICGIVVIAHPLFGLSFLAFLLALYFFMEGAVKIAAAFSYPESMLWFIMSSALSFIFAWIMWANQPASGAWVISIPIGVDLIVTGALLQSIGE
jgi:uncharacterized membrane protein HdeD (DUF308 family)